MKVRLFITNLAKYNEGYLIGKWIELPMDEEELNKNIKEVLGDDEELFISDYEAPFKIHEYSSIIDLNEKMERFESLKEYEQEAVKLLLKSERFDTFDEVLDYVENDGEYIVYRECSGMEDVVRLYITMHGGFREAIGHLDRYVKLPEWTDSYDNMSDDDLMENFNMEQYITDIEIEEDYEKIDNNTYIQFLN